MVNNQDGLRSLYMDNMALSTSDVVESVLAVTPLSALGKIISKGGGKAIANASKLQKVANKVGNAAGKVTGAFGKVINYIPSKIDDLVEYGVSKLDNLPRYTKVSKAVDLGKRVVLTSAMEAMEEGVQYIRGN